MFNPTLFTAALAGAAVLLTMPVAAHADTVYDNLASARSGSDPIFSYGPLADSFTNTTAAWFTGVSALLANGSFEIVGTLRASLHANTAGNTLGVEIASLGTLSSAAVGATFQSHSFAPAAAVLLSPGTRYWVEIAAQTPNAVSWSWSADLTALGVAGEFNHSALLGTSSNAAFAPYQMAVTVSAVPEPSAVLLGALGCAALCMRLRRRTE